MHKLIITVIAMLISLANTAQTSITIAENKISIIYTKVCAVTILPSLRENENRSKEASYYYDAENITITQITYTNNNENTASVYKYAERAKLLTKTSALQSDRYKAGVVYKVTITNKKNNFNEVTF